MYDYPFYNNPFGGARSYYNPNYHNNTNLYKDYLEQQFWYRCSNILLHIANTFMDCDCRVKLINIMSELISSDLPYQVDADSLVNCYINTELSDYYQAMRRRNYDSYEFDETTERKGNIIVYYNDNIIYSSRVNKWFSKAITAAYIKEWCGHDIYDKETFDDAKKHPRPQLKDIKYKTTDASVEFWIYTEKQEV